MPLLDRAGTGVFYEVTGPLNNQTERLPLLLSHGFSASGQMWDGNVPALAADRKVITWDIRGHGRSDSPHNVAQYSEALSVGDMAAVLDRADATRAVVGGLSLGGYLSLAFHLRYPERIAALILCDTGPGYRRDEARAEWNALAERTAESFEQHGLDALGTSAEVVASPHGNATGLALAARGILAQHDARIMDSLPTIAVPTLVLVGADDTPFLAAAEVMAAKIPGATKVVLEGAGHAANLDRPDAFNQAVLTFVEEVEG
jgi:pimeloyl-ACP methyl ester carboxylesterase